MSFYQWRALITMLWSSSLILRAVGAVTLIKDVKQFYKIILWICKIFLGFTLDLHGLVAFQLLSSFLLNLSFSLYSSSMEQRSTQIQGISWDTGLYALHFSPSRTNSNALPFLDLDMVSALKCTKFITTSTSCNIFS